MLLNDSLQRVPFTLLALTPASQSFSSLTVPGLIQECLESYESHANSQFNRASWSDFPHEIAIRVLSCAHYRVQAIRIVFQRARRPSQLDVFSATGSSTDARSGDSLSQYFTAVFEPVCRPIRWPPESILSWPRVMTEIVIPIDSDCSLATPNCGFIKLIFHKPHPHPDNPDALVETHEIELLGTFQLPSRHLHEHNGAWLSRAASVNAIQTPIGGGDLRASLQPAGLPEDLITELTDEPAYSPIPFQPPVVAIDFSTKRPEPELIQPNKTHHDERILESVFGLVVRDYIQRKAHHDRLFASLQTPRNDQHPSIDDVLSQALTLPLDAVQRSQRHWEAIAIHTFGSLFTQCLLQTEDDELRAECVRIAERFAPLLQTAGLPIELVYEGLVAVAVLALSRTGTSVGLFHVTLHLIRTIYQERTASLPLATVVSKGRINIGLQKVMDCVLASAHCWSLSIQTTTRTINRELLQTVRLLLAQEKTRTSFVLAVCNSQRHGNRAQEHTIHEIKSHHTELNRLRLLRWMVQRHVDKLSQDDLGSISHHCESSLIQQPTSAKATLLAGQCLRLLQTKPSPVSDLAAQLAIVKKLVQGCEDAHQDCVDHMPLFDAFPLATAQQESFVQQLRQYFQLHARPVALYTHEFTMESLEDHNGEFHKGNIIFKGHAEARTIPSQAFHDEIIHHSKPFEFRAPRAESVDKLVTMETPFAAFRGTMETRQEEPKLTRSPVVEVPCRPTRRPSNSKLNRVVPVDATLPVVVDTVSVTAESPVSIAPVIHQPDAVIVATVPEQRRISTAAPSLAVPVLPTDTPTREPEVKPAPQPKTAPAGRTRSSATGSPQDTGNGCAIQ